MNTMGGNVNNRDEAALARLRSIFDVFVVLLCFVFVHRIYLSSFDFTVERLLVLVFSVAAGYVILSMGGIYRTTFSESFSESVVKIGLCWFFVALTVGLFAFLSKVAVDVSRLWFGYSMVLSYVFMVLYRAVLHGALVWSRNQGFSYTSVAIVGGGELATLAIKRAQDNQSQGFRVIGIFDDQLSEDEVIEEVKTLGKVSDLTSYIESMRREGTPIEQVWIALPMSAEERIENIIHELRNSSVDVCVLPSLLAIKLLAGTTSQVGELPVINVSEITPTNVGEWYKTFFDFIVALVALIVLSPVLLIIALLVKFDSTGDVLFKQRRYGIDGQEIEVWKFRTMKEEKPGSKVIQAQKSDPRITGVGRILRKTSLDELPQLFNVLQGKMSLVGPRPHAVVHNEEYRSLIDGYMMRHKIKPGITGLAQVKGWRGETDTLEKMEKRVHYDLEYIRRWSPWLDVKIILLTVFHGFTGDNAY